MKMRPLGCVLCAACVLVSSAWAQQDIAPVDLKQLKEVLKLIKDKRATDEKTTQAKVIQDFRAAASSDSAAMAFYEQAVSATKFDGKNHERAEFQDWKKDEADKLKSDAMKTAVRLHLSYLLLSFQRAAGATTQQLEPALQAHAAAVTAALAADVETIVRREKAKEMAARNPMMKGNRPDFEPLFGDQPLVKQGVSNSIFVQWYGIQKMVSNLKEWESTPGNVDGIYQKTLLPYYRQNKDPRVLAYWDARIQREAQAASQSSLAFQIDLFNKVTQPGLVWQRAEDMITIGLRNRGISEMLGLVKNNPEHPELMAWIGKLEAIILSADAATAAPASATPATGNPVPAPTGLAVPAAPAVR